MTIADLKAMSVWSHLRASLYSGIVPPGMVEAIEALPDIEPFRALPGITVAVLDDVVGLLKACSDYKDGE